MQYLLLQYDSNITIKKPVITLSKHCKKYLTRLYPFHKNIHEIFHVAGCIQVLISRQTTQVRYVACVFLVSLFDRGAIDY